MAAAGPSVFLVMVNGQVESAQVSGRGPHGPPLSLWDPWPPWPARGATPSLRGKAREPAWETLGARTRGPSVPRAVWKQVWG